MRIGLLTDAYKPHISGVTNYLALHKRRWEELGHKVFIFTFGAPDQPGDDEFGVIRSPGILLTQSGYAGGVRYPRRVRRLLATMDVVHVHQPFLSGTLALRYCKPLNIPIVATNHTRYDLYSQTYLSALPYPLVLGILRAYLPAFYRQCDLVIAPSEGLRQVMAGLWEVDCPIEVVPNGVDLGPFLNVSEPLNRFELDCSPEDVVLTFVGRLGREKNVLFLLEAFEPVAATCPLARLWIIGEGPEREPLEDWVAARGLDNRVKFTGLVPYDQIPRYLAAADAFVTASVTEVHPLTLIEAMAAGLPVLGIESPGISDTIRPGMTGYLTREDKAEFTAAMVRLCSDHEVRQAMGSRARKLARRYSLENSASTMLAHYQLLVERQREWQPA